MLPSILQAARRIISTSLRPGGTALDGTAGRGRDTLFLARWVGPQGRVIAFEIQPEAIEQTRTRLTKAWVDSRVTLIASSHAHLDRYCDRLDAAMFNLGYLPGSDKSVITQPETTIRSLKLALERLSHRGAMTAVAYPGHPGGDAEAAEVEQWFASQASREQKVGCYRFLTRGKVSPVLYALQKVGPGEAPRPVRPLPDSGGFER